jgi:hypothetical protein
VAGVGGGVCGNRSCNFMEAEEMIPYLGCKQRFAGELLSAIPQADNFYDLFGGGGSITEAAYNCRHGGLLGNWQKWKNIHYNEINKGVYLLNKEIWSGKFDFEHAKEQYLTKERYYAERSQPTAWSAFVSFVWSFGNKNQCFIYGEKLTIRGNEHLQRINRMSKSPILKDIIVTNKDYRKVKIKPSSVAYCDIPYNVNRNHYGIKFDFKAFYEWAASAKFPVYFSDYSCDDDRFKLVWEKLVPVKINMKLHDGGKALYRSEKLFWNGVKL